MWQPYHTDNHERNDAMQTPLYDINDDSDLGDIINDHADRAMTPADIAEYNAWAATQNYPIH